MLLKLYPDHPWRTERFSKDTTTYWKNLENQVLFSSLESNFPKKKFMDELGQKLGVKDWKDWYKVKSDDIMNNGGVYLSNFPL